MSSKMMMDSDDLCASSNTLAISADLDDSEYPTMDSAETILTNGKADEMPKVAANAVFPDPDGPSNNAVRSGVFSEFLTYSTSSLCMGVS